MLDGSPVFNARIFLKLGQEDYLKQDVGVSTACKPQQSTNCRAVGKEICGGFETIPLGSNNIGEFTGCLKGMQCTRSMTNEIEVVWDCMILTKAAPKTHAIKNYALNELLCEIRKLAMCFNEIEFIHVPRELNKQADAIATAAS